MELDDLDALRATFIQLAVPGFNPASTCYLSAAEALNMSAVSFIEAYRLTQENFPSHQDFRRAQETNSLWSWEERGQNASASSALAASSLSSLMGRLGQPTIQSQACDLFERLYPDWSLCYNDFKEAGWECVRDFLKDNQDALNGFLGDDQDMDRAKGSNQIWTVVDTSKSKVVWASSALEGVLARAWDNHPVIIRRKGLVEQVHVRPASASRRF